MIPAYTETYKLFLKKQISLGFFDRTTDQLHNWITKIGANKKGFFLIELFKRAKKRSDHLPHHAFFESEHCKYLEDFLKVERLEKDFIKRENQRLQRFLEKKGKEIR